MKYILIPFMVILVFCSACDKQLDSSVKKESIPQKQSATNSDNIYSYQRYQQFFAKSSTGLVFPDAQLVDHTEATNLVAIDAADSFNTRSFLTLNGDQSNDTTQKQLIYKDTAGDAFTVIDVIYVKHSLGTDMISWPSKALNIAQKEQVLSQYDICLVAYNNILVQITRISRTKPLQLEQMKTKISVVTSYLKKQLDGSN